MLKETKNWLDMVDYHIDTARQMFKTKRYVYVIFTCHLAIEKALKAIVCEETNKFPPKTHDLILLTTIGKAEFPEDLSKLISSYPKEVVQEYLNRTLKVIKCVKQDPRLKK